MPEENNNDVIDTENRYEALKNNPLQVEFDELKGEYKAARKNCMTVHERTTVMEAYQSDLMDIAAEAQMLNDWTLLTQLNSIIQSIDRRTARKAYKKY
mgnify:CR=1 FL=1